MTGDRHLRVRRIIILNINRLIIIIIIIIIMIIIIIIIIIIIKLYAFISTLQNVIPVIVSSRKSQYGCLSNHTPFRSI